MSPNRLAQSSSWLSHGSKEQQGRSGCDAQVLFKTLMFFSVQLAKAMAKPTLKRWIDGTCG